MTGRTHRVYILASRGNGTLYVGVTSGLKVRIWRHKNGRFAGFTSRYGVNKLVHVEDFRDISSARSREKHLKAGSRAKKIALIERANPDWRDLSDGWFD